MEPIRLVDKEIVNSVSAAAKIYISQEVEAEGELVEDIRRATIEAVIAILRGAGINDDKADSADLEEHTLDVSNPHGVTKAQLGLDHVDNSSDMDKPISNATSAALETKVDKEDNAEAMELKADLVSGVVPVAQLPIPIIRIGNDVLYPTTFVDVSDDGEAYVREDGNGEYLLYITMAGIPMLRYMGNKITDDVTGVSYSFSVSNGAAVLKQL